jgi:two-component system phosphate regulon response regulator PhoB
LIGGRVPDLIVLDQMLPGMAGTEVASRLRTNPATAGIPILMLTARSQESDQVAGLAAGADDYVTKPFSTRVLLARIEALLRRASRSAGEDSGALSLGPVTIRTDTHEVRIDGEPVKFTLTEYRLLAALVQGSGKVLSRQTLMGRAMGPGVTVTERTIDVHMTSIRKRLGQHSGLLKTVRGVGYRLTAEAMAEES